MNAATAKTVSKTATLRALRVEHKKDDLGSAYLVYVGEGATRRTFSASTSEAAAIRSRADIRRDPAAYGIA